MATQTIKMRIQFRRDTTENWLLNKGIIPAAGEPCYDLDLKTLRIGDGSTTYENLPVIGEQVELSADGKSIVLEDNVFKLVGFDTAKAGAQLIKNADGNMEWVVPSTEAVDDLKEEVSGLKTDVTNLQTNVTEITQIIMPSEGETDTILDRVVSLETKMDGTGEGTVDAKIDAKINEFAKKVTDGNTIDTFKELVDYVANHGGEVESIVNDITTLQGLVGEESVSEQISTAIKNSGHMDKEEALSTLLSKVEARATLERVKYEIANTPVGTLVDYRDKEIRVMVPAGAEFTKQSVGAGGDANSYYMTFKTYAPDNAVGYIEHLGGQSDEEILTSFSTDKYGRRYQPTWLALAKYDETADTWTYYGASSSKDRYIGWDYQIDWYDANGVMIESDKIRINLSNEACHNAIEPYYMAGVVKQVSVNGTLQDVIDGKVDIEIPTIKGSDEIEVSEDGTLSIKEISIDKIVQNEDDYIILDGGGAA